MPPIPSLQALTTLNALLSTLLNYFKRTTWYFTHACLRTTILTTLLTNIVSKET